jgi:hypothetical protein
LTSLKKWLRDVRTYLRELFWSWATAATGTVITLALLVMDVAGWKLTAVGWLVGGVVLLIPGGFMAWRRQRTRIEVLEVLHASDTPAFRLSCMGYSFVGLENLTDGTQITMLVVPLRVTNEGGPGAALDWRCTIECHQPSHSYQKLYTCKPLGHFHTTWPIKVSDLVIERDDLIEHRTKDRLKRGKTVEGWFLGAAPAEVFGWYKYATRSEVSCFDGWGRHYGVVLRDLTMLRPHFKG